MKIAFFSPAPFSKKLGATKNRIEMAETLSSLGWETFLVGNEELGLPTKGVAERPVYREHLKNYLIENAYKYDVVIYEYDTLPFDRTLFSSTTLLIARPALLHYHFLTDNIPHDFKANIHSFIKKINIFLGFIKDNSDKKLEPVFRKSLTECDVIQVQNNLDKQCLIDQNYIPGKIIVVPNGISNDRLALFNKIIKTAPEIPKIAFVGSFDYRKGAMDFPYIVSAVIKIHPKVKFKLIGTNGMFLSSDDVLNFFPSAVKHAIEVIHRFEPNALPTMLADCQLGVFPSYIESFGFGALEMMAAGLPVVSYNSPGPSDFIIKELLVPVGDKINCAQKLISLLDNPTKLGELALQAKHIAEAYNWSNIGAVIAKKYEELHQELMSAANNKPMTQP